MIQVSSAKPTPGAGRAQPTRWLLILGAWTAIGLLFSAQQVVGASLRGAPMSWWTALLLELPLTSVWALATPTILWLARQLPIERRRWARNVTIHLIVCNGFIFLTALGFAWHARNVLPSPATTPLLQRAIQLFVVWVFADGLAYWIIIGIGMFVDHQRRLREHELIASQLETQLAQAELRALKMQLEPHFLFNALHTVGALVRAGDRENAVRVVTGLGDLLRTMLDEASHQQVTLEQELAFVRNYLAIEQVRFRDRLTVTITSDPALASVPVPHLVLQPLVENAIRHGIARRVRAGHVAVSVRRVNDRLHMVVRDDGPGITEANGDTMRTGIGLANTRARLERLYGGAFELEVINSPSGGLEATILLPIANPAPAHGTAG